MIVAKERIAEVLRPTAFLPEEQLVGAARQGDDAARSAIFERHATHVARVLVRLLGSDSELSDLLHDVFTFAFRDLDRLTDAAALKAWLTAIAVNTARGHIRLRVRRRWLRFLAPEELPEVECPWADEETRAAMRATYTILQGMDADERIAFALRFIDGMELTEAAAACGVSLATIKRRLARAETTFVTRAREAPVLEGWLDGGSRWAAK
jgi:RNA polymerase sigma-70 factor (ECF subfamily)